ncbi:Panacea domain-containing protein [Actinomyces urogenitalis]|uniref:Panacea domain-containing protein n=1 Tax=Actinomyces urogenitalis TaxID=103621 RepID=UPI00242E1841|nr:Panacea domain-containing protein [Actinomyces urogenitalis]MCI7457609.1 Panacea domain-containing protein [Actinomyces urogenitalis]
MGASRVPDPSPLKLHKLCYYAQAWHLAITNEPLFRSDMQAWRYGPVSTAVYYHLDQDNHSEPQPDAFTSVERTVVDLVLKQYGWLSQRSWCA